MQQGNGRKVEDVNKFCGFFYFDFSGNQWDIYGRPVCDEKNRYKSNVRLMR